MLVFLYEGWWGQYNPRKTGNGGFTDYSPDETSKPKDLSPKEVEYKGKKYKMWYGGLYVTMRAERNIKATRLSNSSDAKDRLKSVPLLEAEGSIITLKRLSEMMRNDKDEAVQKAAKKAYESLKATIDKEQKDFQDRKKAKEKAKQDEDEDFTNGSFFIRYDDEEEEEDDEDNDDDVEEDEEAEEDDDDDTDDDEDDNKEFVPGYLQ